MTQLKTTAPRLRGSFPARLARGQGSGEPAPGGQPGAKPLKTSAPLPPAPQSPHGRLTPSRLAQALLRLPSPLPTQKTLAQVNTGARGRGHPGLNSVWLCACGQVIPRLMQTTREVAPARDGGSWLTAAELSEARPGPKGPPCEEATSPVPALRWPLVLLVGRWEAPHPLTAGGTLPPCWRDPPSLIRNAGPSPGSPLAPILSP